MQIFQLNLNFEENSGFDCVDLQNENINDTSFPKSPIVFNRNRAPLSRKYKKSKNYIMPNGFFRTDVYSLPPDNYCISRITTEEIEIKTCFPRPFMTQPIDGIDLRMATITGRKQLVLRKCCPLGQTIHLNLTHLKGPKCREAFGAQEWSPKIFKRVSGFFRDKFVRVSEPGKDQPIFYQNNMGCENFGILTPNTEIKYSSFISEFRILENGKVVSRSDGNTAWDDPKNPGQETITHFCVDGLVNTGSWATQAEDAKSFDGVQIYDSKDPKNEIYLYCNDEALEEQTQDVYGEMFFYLALVSVLILLAIVIIYGLIWSSQNIHGWTKASFSLSMLLNFVFFVITQGLALFDSSSEIVTINSALCISIGCVEHFFEIATFTWMSILNFDLYTTISSITPIKTRSKGKLRFLRYCCFGFGIPTLVVSVSLILDMQFDLFDDRVFRPQYGYHASCSLVKSARLYYFVVPTMILFAFNILLAGLTAKFLYDAKKGTKCLMKDANNNTPRSHQNTKLFFKLFVLMGFTWIFEIISWIGHVQEKSYSWYWAIFDSYNFLQAIGLFWIFVCRKDVKDQLCSKYEPIDAIFKWMGQTVEQKRSKTGNSIVAPSTSVPNV